VLRGFLYDGQTLHKSKRYTISPIVDRIGGGDAFMAGYIYGYLNDFSAQKTLEFAVAASVLKHTIEGDFNLASIEEINSLLAGEVGKLRR
jgi:2-dehydro-3-deoxygluconokinase